MKGSFFKKRQQTDHNVEDSQIIPQKKFSKKNKTILFSAISLVVCAAIVVGCLAAFLPKKPVSLPNGFEVMQFASKNALIAKLSADGQTYNTNSGDRYNGLSGMMMSPSSSQEKDGSSSGDSHSSTNVQVEGLDEADIIKVDGNYIYTLNYDVLRIILVNSGQMSVVWTSDFIESNFYADEIVIEGDRLAVLGRSYTEYVPLASSSPPEYGDQACYCYNYYYNTSMIAVRIYDIVDRANPILLTEVKHSGYYNTARLSGTTLYYVAQYNYYGYDVENVLPKVQDGSGEDLQEISLDNVYYISGLPQNTYTTIGKIDLNNIENHEYNSIIAGSGTVYFSGENIYLCDNNYYPQFVSNGFVSLWDDSVSGTTRIIKVNSGNLEIEAIGEINGTVSDRYWLDEYNGNLRVATVTGWNSYSNIFVLDNSLKEIGKITNIAPGEGIYSVRFNKEKGSIVTFKTVDPLFLLDLSDPTNPRISEGLKKEGVSFYLHPIEGTDYILGLGRDTDESGVMKGIELVLFDNSGSEAVIVGAPIIIGDYGWSDALYDPRAILYDKEKNIFGFGATYSTSYSYNYLYYSSYFVFGFEGGVLSQRVKISHSRDTSINRSVVIGDYLYAVSYSKITSHLIEADIIVELATHTI